MDNSPDPSGSRKRLRPLIEWMLNTHLFVCHGLKWINKDKKIFRLPWKIRRKSREGDSDRIVLKFIANWMWPNKWDPKDWKCTLRNDMNNVSDFQLLEECKEDNYKVYMIVDKNPGQGMSKGPRSQSNMSNAKDEAQMFSSQPQSGSFRSRSPIFDALEPQSEDQDLNNILEEMNNNCTFPDAFLDCLPEHGRENTKDVTTPEDAIVGIGNGTINLPNLSEFHSDLPASTFQFSNQTLITNTENLLADQFLRNDSPADMALSIFDTTATASHPFSISWNAPHASVQSMAAADVSTLSSIQQSTFLYKLEDVRKHEQKKEILLNDFVTKHDSPNNGKTVDFPSKDKTDETSPTACVEIPAALPSYVKRPLMCIEVFYYNVSVYKDTLFDPTFTLYHGSSAFSPGVDLGKRIQLPDLDSLPLQSKIRQNIFTRIKDMWPKICLGITISMENENIHALRRCRSGVLAKVINNPSAKRLERWEKSQVFNLRSKFEPLLAQHCNRDYRDKNIPLVPSDSCRFTFGVTHPMEDDKHGFIDVYVQHMEARRLLSETLHHSLTAMSSDASETNSLDRLIEPFNAIHM